MLIVYATVKGGVGKTTLAVHHAAWLHDCGHTVALLDCDSQLLSSAWLSAAEPAISVATANTPKSAARELGKLRASHDFVIADGPGSNDPINAALLAAADLALLPFNAQPMDFWSAVNDTTTFVREVRRQNAGRPIDARFVCNSMDLRTRASHEILEALPDLELPTCRSRLRRLWPIADAFPNTLITRTQCARSMQAKRDMNSLFNELISAQSSRSDKTNHKHRKAANE